MDISIQPIVITFLSLLLAHLLADFPFQPEWIARSKGKRAWPTIVHGLCHYVTAWVCLALFARTSFLTAFHQLLLAVYVLTHLTIDAIKLWLTSRNRIHENGVSFVVDQIAHVLTIAIAAMALAGSGISEVFARLHFSPQFRLHFLVAAIVYVGIVFGGGYLIRYLTKGLAKGVATEAPEQLRNAGLYIGWLERFLVITAIAVQSPALVGLILTGKSIARFPELKEARFAEYFLIGTLLSTALALCGGLVLAAMLFGTLSLK
jgi:hypothetical protein